MANKIIVSLVQPFSEVPSFLQVSKKYVSKETSSQIHEKAAPFIKWLQEAEEESSEEEEENGEDVEVVYATDAGREKILAEEKKKVQEDEDDDDLDIDEI